MLTCNFLRGIFDEASLRGSTTLLLPGTKLDYLIDGS